MSTQKKTEEANRPIVVSVSWGYELHDCPMSERTWKRIVNGQVIRRVESDWYEGEKYTTEWIFNSSYYGSLTVGTCDVSSREAYFNGDLTEAIITDQGKEITWVSTKQYPDCPFCNMEKSRIITDLEHAYMIRDAFPVTDQHTLIIPKRHVRNFFDLDQEEINGCRLLLKYESAQILSHDNSVKGFNIGVNVGEVAGQTIFHCHIHLIPRREGDVSNPRGGVRNIIPGRGDY